MVLRAGGGGEGVAVVAAVAAVAHPDDVVFGLLGCHDDAARRSRQTRTEGGLV